MSSQKLSKILILGAMAAVALSVVGYEHLTRPKSFHLRTRT
jgi:uncharacterized membrane protein